MSAQDSPASIDVDAANVPSAAELFHLGDQIAAYSGLAQPPRATIGALIAEGDRVISGSQPGTRIEWAAYAAAAVHFFNVAGVHSPGHAVQAAKLRQEMARQRVNVLPRPRRR
jgi:hypothetical protein